MSSSHPPARRRARVGRRGRVVAVDYRALAELRHQLRRFLVFSERAARAAGVEPRQHQLLLAVKGLPLGQHPTISVLAERLQVKHHTVVGMADRLADANLLQRARSPRDHREILLRITPRGERLLRGLSLAHRAELESAGPALASALASLLGGARAHPAARGRR